MLIPLSYAIGGWQTRGTQSREFGGSHGLGVVGVPPCSASRGRTVQQEMARPLASSSWPGPRLVDSPVTLKCCGVCASVYTMGLFDLLTRAKEEWTRASTKQMWTGLPRNTLMPKGVGT